MSNFNIRKLNSDDYNNWLILWNLNNNGDEEKAVTEHTWKRLTDENYSEMGGFVAEIDNKIVGIVHYVIHPTTGSIDDICYMQDLYIDESYRRKGIGLSLVEKLSEFGRSQNWSRIYWFAASSNEKAKDFYKKIGFKLDFDFYAFPLKS